MSNGHRNPRCYRVCLSSITLALENLKTLFSIAFSKNLFDTRPLTVVSRLVLSACARSLRRARAGSNSPVLARHLFGPVRTPHLRPRSQPSLSRTSLANPHALLDALLRRGFSLSPSHPFVHALAFLESPRLLRIALSPNRSSFLRR